MHLSETNVTGLIHYFACIGNFRSFSSLKPLFRELIKNLKSWNGLEGFSSKTLAEDKK